MRTPRRGLTLRGRCLVAAGLATGACALALQQRDLMRVAVFLLALPTLALAAAARTRFRLAGSRRLEPDRVPVGQPAQVVLTLRNVSRMPTGVLLAEDSLPDALGERPRWRIDRLAPQQLTEVRYPIRSDARGRFRLGPLTVRVADPFGLSELTRSFTATVVLVVTPAVTPLPPVRPASHWGGRGGGWARPVAVAGTDDVATREYHDGDDLRRVHWRSTARRGELMVRREEQPWQSQATLFLDTRARAHLGSGPTSSLEWAVAAAASVGVHLMRCGYAVRLTTADGEPVGAAARRTVAGQTALLDALAVVTPSPAQSLAFERGAGRGSNAAGLLVAILGLTTPDQAEQLVRWRRHGGVPGLAIVLDTASWTGAPTPVSTLIPAGPAAGPGAGPAAGLALLQRAGWRVLPVRRGQSLAQIWPQAAVPPVPPPHRPVAASVRRDQP